MSPIPFFLTLRSKMFEAKLWFTMSDRLYLAGQKTCGYIRVKRMFSTLCDQ